MWVKFEIIPDKNKFIYIPLLRNHKFTKTTLIKFGGISVNAETRRNNRMIFGEANSYMNPVVLKISSALKETLLIKESLIYRLKVEDDRVIIGPVIGLLLGEETDRYNIKHMKKYSDRFGIYNEVGGLIYAFSPKLVNWENNTAFGLFYNIEVSDWEYGNFPLPEVIYRRDFHTNPDDIEKLIKITESRLFNSYRFSKYELYELISQNEELCNHLPPTELSSSYAQVKSFIDNNLQTILKPVDLSRGRGLCIIEKVDSSYKIIDYRGKVPDMYMLYDDEGLENFFLENDRFFVNYLIQRYLPLAKIGNSIFDVRVVMQKNANREWVRSGIECRVSKEDTRITNISRGGYALSLEESLKLSFENDYEFIPQQIDDFCHKFCICMDATGENYAEFGIDLAVDEDKKLWLIEANVFPSFKGFKYMDYQTYLNIRYTPLLYALSLSELGG